MARGGHCKRKGGRGAAESLDSGLDGKLAIQGAIPGNSGSFANEGAGHEKTRNPKGLRAFMLATETGLEPATFRSTV